MVVFMHRHSHLPQTSIRFLAALILCISSAGAHNVLNADESQQVKVATFDIDATPSIGSMMAYDRVVRVEEMGLRARGIVLLGGGQPIVLCAVDWIGIGNGGHDAFRERLANAAGTTRERVAVHTLHQHDAPRCDFSAEQLLNNIGVSDLGPHDGALARDVIKRIGISVTEAIKKAKPVTHYGIGVSEVEKVASNRRILDDQGKVRATRYTTCRDPKLRAEPDGVIDPELTSLSFWNEETPVAVLTYYACHPQSYYRTGVPSPDFPGIARFMRGQDLPNTLHVHFNGAGGNIGAGKYNDGDKANRRILAERVANGMRSAFESTTKKPLKSSDLGWGTVPVALPVAEHLKEQELREKLPNWTIKDYWGSADDLAWLMRCKAGSTIDLTCLHVGEVSILHLPGELFVEYQIAAKALRKDRVVAMAAYGDYGPGYIGTEIAYTQGGYETSQRASKVGPGSEKVLMDGIKQLLLRDAPAEIKKTQ